MSRFLSEAVLAGLSAACHVFAASIFALQRIELGLPRAGIPQFYALVAASLAASLVAAALKKPTPRRAALGASVLCYALATYPLPASSGIQLALGMPLAVSIVAYFPRPDYFVAGATFLALALILQGPVVAWGVAGRGGSVGNSAAMAFALVFAFALGAALKEMGESRRRAVAESRRLDEAIDRIAAINAGFQSALAAAEEESVLKERNRITREIHDIVGYALTNQQMMIEAALMLVGPGGGRLGELLAMAREGVAEGLRETRKTLYQLRRMDEPRGPDVAVILRMARNFEAVTGVKVSVDFGNARGELGQGAWTSVYRLIQESMINAFRHGQAARIAITLREDEGAFHVLVRDDGKGAPAISEGIGLKGMRERIAALGGEFEAGSGADGFAVSASVPKGGAR